MKPNYGDSTIILKEDILDLHILIMTAQNITNIFYALLGMGIVVYAVNHIST